MEKGNWTFEKMADYSQKNLRGAFASKSVKLNDAAESWLKRNDGRFLEIKNGYFCVFAPNLVYSGDLRKKGVDSALLCQPVPIFEVAK